MNQKVLILGGTGMLGHKLVQAFSERFDVRYTIRGEVSSTERFGLFPTDYAIPNVSVENAQSVRIAIERENPDVVINAIGVIKQLPSAKDVKQVLTTNSIFPQSLAELAEKAGFRLISLSTDCVFSGSEGMYTEEETVDALDLYGQSKHWGEVHGPNCLTLRTSIIGREIGTSHSLIDWFLSQNSSVKGYANAIYSGFPTIVLADILTDIINDHKDLQGLYHVSSDPISKYDLLNLVKDRLSLDIEIRKDTDFKINRSLDSSRFRQETGFQPLPWPEMVDRMLSDPTPYDDFRELS